MKWFPEYNYILASKSPRRQQLLKMLGLEFKVVSKEVEENFPENLPKEEIPVYLARLKARSFQDELQSGDLLITADTIVWLNGRVMGKPATADEAGKMLSDLSGKEHQVISGVRLTSPEKYSEFFATSNVQFKTLTDSEIEHYISEYKPFDKAGAYGIQEWIGLIGIKRIEGSFYNVMGMPVQKLYEEIMHF
ncbi:MAG: Maf family nucleotide pyrophosphatase [Tangfeifania sp.]